MSVLVHSPTKLLSTARTALHKKNRVPTDMWSLTFTSFNTKNTTHEYVLHHDISRSSFLLTISSFYPITYAILFLLLFLHIQWQQELWFQNLIPMDMKQYILRRSVSWAANLRWWLPEVWFQHVITENSLRVLFLVALLSKLAAQSAFLKCTLARSTSLVLSDVVHNL